MIIGSHLELVCGLELVSTSSQFQNTSLKLTGCMDLLQWDQSWAIQKTMASYLKLHNKSQTAIDGLVWLQRQIEHSTCKRPIENATSITTCSVL